MAGLTFMDGYLVMGGVFIFVIIIYVISTTMARSYREAVFILS
jgi:hypothetical protein